MVSLAHHETLAWSPDASQARRVLQDGLVGRISSGHCTADVDAVSIGCNEV